MPIRPWEDVENDIMPNLSIPREEARRIYEAQQQLDEQRQVESQRTSEGVGEYLRRRAVPFVSSIGNFLDASNHADATDRINRGTHSPSDILAVAHHERAEEIDRGRGWGGQLLSGLTHIPAVLGEFAVGGAAFRGLTGASRLGSVAAWGGRTLGTTALAPSMYADQAAQTNIAANRHPTDPRGFGTAYLAGALQTAILGSVGSQVNKAFGSGIASTLGRMGISGPVGVIESTAANALAHWTGLQNGYGATMDSLLKGEYGEAGAHFASEALTFAVFAGLHEAQHRAKIGMKPGLPEATEQVLNAAADHMQTAAEQGKPPEQAASELPGSVRTAMDAAGIHPDVGRPILVNPQGEATTPGQRDAAAQRIAELRARGLSDDQIAKAFLYGDKPKVPQEATPQAPQGPQGPSAPAEQPQAQTPTQPPRGTPEATPGPPQAPAASPEAPQTQRRQTPPEVRQAALEVIDSLGGKDAKTKAANRADVESIASSREFADPGELVQEVYRERGKGNAQGQDTGWLKAPAEPSPVEATPAEKPSPASWESLHERAAAGDVAARKEVSDRAGLTKTEAADYWRRLENPGMTYAELAGKVGRKEGSMRTYVSSARKKINESSGGMFDKAKAAATAAAEAEKQRRLAQGATVEGLQGSGPARPTADEMTGDRLANWWETKTGVNLAEQNSEGAHRKADDFISELAAVKGNRKGEAAAEALKRAYPELQEFEPEELKSLVYNIEDHQRAYQRNAGGTGPSAPEGPRGEDANRGAGEAAGGAPAQEARPEAVPPRFGGREGAVPVEPAAAPAVGQSPGDLGKPQGRHFSTGVPPEISPNPRKIFVGGRSSTAQANAEADRLRSMNGLPRTFEAAAREAGPTVWAEAMKRIDANKQHGEQLVADIIKNPKPVDAPDGAVLLHRMIDLTNQKNAVEERINAATSPEAKDAQEKQWQKVVDQLGETDRANYLAGNETGRSLWFRRIMANNQYELTGLLRSAQAAKKAPLTEAEKTQLDTHAKTIKDLQDKLAAAETALAKAGTGIEGPEYGPWKDADLAAKRATGNADEYLGKMRWDALPPLQRTLNKAMSLRVAFVISSPITNAKILASSVAQIAKQPILEVVASALRWVPGIAPIAERAPVEGRGFNAEAMGKSLGQVPEGVKQGWKVLKTGKSDLDVRFGRQDTTPRTYLDYLGSLHAAEKQPAVQAKYELARQNLFAAEKAAGHDVTSPAAIERLEQQAYEHSIREKFQQDNAVNTAWNKAVASLKGSESGGAQALGHAMDFMAPVRKTALNIIADSFSYLLGMPIGAARTALAHAKGIENLKQGQAESIMRQLKMGTIGLPLLALGYFLKDSVGGFYSGKRSSEDLGVGEIDTPLGRLPAWVTAHHPAFMALHFGATLARSSEAVKKGEAAGMGGAIVGAFGHMIEEVPMVRAQTEALRSFEGGFNSKAMGKLAASFAVPQLVQWAARQTDTADTVHKPEGFGQAFGMAVPGWRNTVPGISQSLEDFNIRHGQLNQLHQAHVMGPGRLGQAFPQAQEHAMLQAYGRPIGRLQEVLNGRSRRMGYRGPEQDPAHEAYLRSQINRLAKEALERTRGVRR